MSRITKKMIEDVKEYNEKKGNFNTWVMRELNLSTADQDDDDPPYLCYANNGEDEINIIKYKGKFIKVSDEVDPIIGLEEIDFDCIKNSRLLHDALFQPWWVGYCASHNWEPKTISFNKPKKNIDGKGYFEVSYIDLADGKSKTIESEKFKNESLQIFSLITIIRKSSHRYRNLDDYDILPTEVPCLT